MASDETRAQLAALLIDCGAYYEKPFSRARVEEFLDVLGEVTPAELSAAILAHKRNPSRGQWAPFPADLLAHIPRARGASSDSAWSLCVRSFDERATVLISDAIDAGRAAALPIWEEGDKIGARMAFRDAYERATAGGAPQRWRLSLGHNPRERDEAIREAVALGVLSNESAAGLLSGPTDSEAVAVVRGLLAGTVPKGAGAGRFRAAVESGLVSAKVRQAEARAQRQAETNRARREMEARRVEMVEAIERRQAGG